MGYCLGLDFKKAKWDLGLKEQVEGEVEMTGHSLWCYLSGVGDGDLRL